MIAQANRLLRWVVAASLWWLPACSASDLLNATVPLGDTQVTRDVVYATGPRGTLDVYRPAHPKGPLVVFLYGGGWTMGEKSMYPFVARPLASLGAVVVVPNYRLYPEVRFPSFVNDNAAAVAWALNHAESLGADPRSVFVVGHSAGAYNAAMLALDPSYLQRAGVSRDRLAGVVALSGPYDFLPLVGADVIAIFSTAQDGPASQPITYVDGHNPPMFLLTGTDDSIVRPRNTESLARRITQAGGPVETRFYPGVDHIGIVTAFAPLFARRAPVLNDVWSFIQRHEPAK